MTGTDADGAPREPSVWQRAEEEETQFWREVRRTWPLLLLGFAAPFISGALGAPPWSSVEAALTSLVVCTLVGALAGLVLGWLGRRQRRKGRDASR